MKKTLFSALLLAAATASASWVTNNFTSTSGGSNTIKVAFVPTGTPMVLADGKTAYSSPVDATATNGVLAPTWVVAGYYDVTFGPQSDTWQVAVPDDSTTYCLVALATNVNVSTNVPSLPGVSSIAAVTVPSSSNSLTVANTGPSYTITLYSSTNAGGGGETNATLLNGIAGTATLSVQNVTGPSNGASLQASGSSLTVQVTNGPSMSPAAVAAAIVAATNTISPASIAAGTAGISITGSADTATTATYAATAGTAEQRTNFLSMGGIADADVANLCYSTPDGSNLVRLDGLAWPAGIVGKHMRVVQAGTGGNNDLMTGVFANPFPSQITLSNAVVSAVTNVPAYYGSDNSTAMSNMFASTAKVFVPKGNYYFDNPIQDIGALTNHHNSQFCLPNYSCSNTIVIGPYVEIEGPLLASDFLYGQGRATNWVTLNGACFINGYCANTQGRMIDCQNFTSGVLQTLWKYPFSMNGCGLAIRNVTFIEPVNSAHSGLNMEGCLACKLENVRVTTGQVLYCGVKPTYDTAAIVMPGNGCAMPSEAIDCVVEGFSRGFQVSEHSTFMECRVNNANNAFYSAQGFDHDVFVVAAHLQGCATNFLLDGYGAGTLHFEANIENHVYGMWTDAGQSIVDGTRTNAGGGNLRGTYNMGYSYIPPISPQAYHMSGWLASSGGTAQEGVFASPIVIPGTLTFNSLPPVFNLNGTYGCIDALDGGPTIHTVAGNGDGVWMVDHNNAMIARLFPGTSASAVHGGATYWWFNSWMSNNLPVIDQHGLQVAQGLTNLFLTPGMLVMTGVSSNLTNVPWNTFSNAVYSNLPPISGGIYSDGNTIVTNVGRLAASNWLGAVNGDVTGHQSNMVVATVDGVLSANVASGANAANSATTTPTPGVIAMYDSDGALPQGVLKADIDADNPISSDASGNLTAWTFNSVNPSGGFVGNGSLLTGLNAGNFSSGTVPQAAMNPLSVTNNNASIVTLASNLVALGLNVTGSSTNNNLTIAGTLKAPANNLTGTLPTGVLPSGVVFTNYTNIFTAPTNMWSNGVVSIEFDPGPNTNGILVKSNGITVASISPSGVISAQTLKIAGQINANVIYSTNSIGTANTVTATNGVIQQVIATNGNYTCVASNSVIIETAATNSTVTLMTAVGNAGKEIAIKAVGALSATTITVATTSSQNIDGATTKVLSIQYSSIKVISDGTQWWITGEYTPGVSL